MKNNITTIVQDELDKKLETYEKAYSNLATRNDTVFDLSTKTLDGETVSYMGVCLTFENKDPNLIISYRQADFSGMQHFTSTFNNCRLREARFDNGKLYHCKFENSDLSKADFRNAILLGLKVPKTILDEADLTGALLIDSILSDASSVKDMQLTGAIILNTTMSRDQLAQVKFRKILLDEKTLKNMGINTQPLEASLFLLTHGLNSDFLLTPLTRKQAIEKFAVGHGLDYELEIRRLLATYDYLPEEFSKNFGFPCRIKNNPQQQFELNLDGNLQAIPLQNQIIEEKHICKIDDTHIDFDGTHEKDNRRSLV